MYRFKAIWGHCRLLLAGGLVAAFGLSCFSAIAGELNSSGCPYELRQLSDSNLRVKRIIGDTPNANIDTALFAGDLEQLRELSLKRPAYHRDGKYGAVAGDQDSLLLVPPSIRDDQLWSQFNKAFFELQEILHEYDLGIHVSLSHSVQDVFTQVSILVGAFDVSNNDVYRLSKAVLLYHFIDDLVETWGRDVEKFKDFWLRGHVSGVGFSVPRTPQVVSELIDDLRFQLQFILNKEAENKNSDVDRREKILGGSLVRMLMGLDLFQKGRDEEMTGLAWKKHKRLLNSFLESRDVLDLVHQLDPLFVAFSVNSLLEVLHISLPEHLVYSYSSFDESIFLALILGPLFHGHNEELEIELGENSAEYRIEATALGRNLAFLATRFKTLRPTHKQEIQAILGRALYAMKPVIGESTVLIYQQLFELEASKK